MLFSTFGLAFFGDAFALVDLRRLKVTRKPAGRFIAIEKRQMSDTLAVDTGRFDEHQLHNASRIKTQGISLAQHITCATHHTSTNQTMKTHQQNTTEKLSLESATIIAHETT